MTLLEAVDGLKGEAAGVVVPQGAVERVDRGEDPDLYAVERIQALNAELEGQRDKAARLAKLAGLLAQPP